MEIDWEPEQLEQLQAAAEQEAEQLGKNFGSALLRMAAGPWNYRRLVRSFWRGIKSSISFPILPESCGWELQVVRITLDPYGFEQDDESDDSPV